MPKKPTRPLKHQLIYFITESETKCAYCGRRYDDEKTKKTMDHVVPKSKGGETSLANIIICCQNCNVKKGNEDMDVFIKQNKRVKANLLNTGITIDNFIGILILYYLLLLPKNIFLIPSACFFLLSRSLF